MAEALKIRLAARCEAAGRPENEDNFQVAEDLSVSNTGFTTDKVFSLGSKGTLLLVCDGMGGMMGCCGRGRLIPRRHPCDFPRPFPQARP